MPRIYYPEEIAAMELANPGMRFDRHGRPMQDASDPYGLEGQLQDLFYKPGYDASQPSWNQLYQNYGPADGDALSRAVAGLDGYNYQSDQFVGPVLPGQQPGYRYSDYDQAGPLQPGVSNLSLPNVGFYSQWNPDTNSWVRHGAPSGGAYRQPDYGGAANPSYGGARRQRGFVPAGPGYEKPDNPYMKFSDRPAPGGQDVFGDFPDMYGA